MIKTGWTHAGAAINPSLNTHNLVDRELHAARRRLLNSAFSDRAMGGLDKYIVAQIRQWCAYLGQADENVPVTDEKPTWGKARDMAQWSTNLTVDVLGELCFGSSFDAMKQGGSYILDLLLASSRFQQAVSDTFLSLA